MNECYSGPIKGSAVVVIVGFRPQQIEPSGQLAEHCAENLGGEEEPAQLLCDPQAPLLPPPGQRKMSSTRQLMVAVRGESVHYVLAPTGRRTLLPCRRPSLAGRIYLGSSVSRPNDSFIL
jgi:hypothetical protein